MSHAQFLRAFLLITFLLVFSACDEDNVTEPDSTNPVVTFTTLVNNSIVDNPATIEVTATDQGGINSVDLVVNGSLAGHFTQDGGVWSIQMYWYNATVGDTAEIIARARDNDGNTTNTNPINVVNEYISIGIDDVEVFPRNLTGIYARANDEYLGFMLEFSEVWGNPYSINEGIDCSIFIDADRDQTTGLSETDDFPYSFENIGTDYMILCGFEGNGLYSWNNQDTSWDLISTLQYLSLFPNSSTLELAISLDQISSTQHLDLVAGSITYANETIYMDWMPDEESISLPVLNQYVGNDYDQQTGQIQLIPKSRPFYWLQ